MNEVSFAGASFLEGFLSMYGIELEGTVRRYEEKLQLFETIDQERKQRAMLEAMKQVEKERALAPSLEVERDES